MRKTVVLLLVLAGYWPPLHAQHLAQLRFPSGEPSPRHRSDGMMLAMGGALGALAGLLGGGTIGARITEHDCDDCALVGAVYGGIAGASSLLPLGVHLADRSQGDYGKSLLASLALGAAGLALASSTDEWRIMLAAPVAQIASSIAIERRTRRQRDPN